MAQNITLLGASYSDVPAVELPKTGGGTASFTDVTDTTALASDVLQGKYFFNASGVLTLGTNQGGSGDGYVWQDSQGYVHLSDEEGTQPIYDTLTVSSSGTFTPATGHAYNSVVVPSGTAGYPTATKGAVSNHSVNVTPSVTNTTGYITGSTKTGTAVSVAASELVSGTKTITDNGTGIDVTNYANVDVAVDASLTKTATISGTGHRSYCYVMYNDTQYYNSNSFTFTPGDTLVVYSRAARSKDPNGIYVNGQKISIESGYSYSYTLPDSDVNITFNYSSSTLNSINILYPIIPTGALTITAPGTYSVFNYSTVTVGYIKMNRIDITVDGTAYSSCRIVYNGKSYYTDGDFIAVSYGDTISFYSSYGEDNKLYIDNVLVAGGTSTTVSNYSYTVSSDLEVVISPNRGESTIRVTTS